MSLITPTVCRSLARITESLSGPVSCAIRFANSIGSDLTVARRLIRGPSALKSALLFLGVSDETKAVRRWGMRGEEVRRRRAGGRDAVWRLRVYGLWVS